jgi:GIY-YIG catalytic domain
MKLDEWASISFQERDRLPNCSGIYVVADFNDFVWYVGQATNLKNRWIGRSHHRYPQLVRSCRKLGHKIYWKFFPADQLTEQERYYITLFRPELNTCKVKTYLPKQPQVDREIKRILTAINRPSFLFPVIRSIALGEYQNENGKRCLLIATNPNDYTILYNSTKKRYSSAVKKAWISIKSHCGKSKEQYNPVCIFAYALNECQIEFITVGELIQHLEENSTLCEQAINKLDLFGTKISALKNLNILTDLNLPEEYLYINEKKNLADIAYFNYRKQDLTPISS